MTRPPLLALLGSRGLRDRVRAAVKLGGWSEIVGDLALASGWTHLEHLAEQHPGSPAVVDTFPEGPGRFRRGFGRPYADDLPSIPLICHDPFGTVARGLGFSAPSNYRRLVRGLLRRPPSVIRRLGGGDYMAKVILERLG